MSVQLNSEFSKEVAIQEAVDAFKRGDVVAARFDNGDKSYAAYVYQKDDPFMASLRELTFDMLADAKFYIRG